MTPNRRVWLHYGLASAAIMCSIVSLFALVEMGAPRWTTPLNAVSIVLVLLAVKTRGRRFDANDS